MEVTKANFQAVRKDEELNDLLNKMASGVLKEGCCAHSLSDNIGHPRSFGRIKIGQLCTYYL